MGAGEQGWGHPPSLPVLEELLEDGTLSALGQNLHLSVWGISHSRDEAISHLEGRLPLLLIGFSPWNTGKEGWGGQWRGSVFMKLRVLSLAPQKTTLHTRPQEVEAGG